MNADTLLPRLSIWLIGLGTGLFLPDSMMFNVLNIPNNLMGIVGPGVVILGVALMVLSNKNK